MKISRTFSPGIPETTAHAGDLQGGFHGALTAQNRCAALVQEIREPAVDAEALLIKWLR